MHKKRESYEISCCQWHISYRWRTLLQLNAFIMLPLTLKEMEMSSRQKGWAGWMKPFKEAMLGPFR